MTRSRPILRTSIILHKRKRVLQILPPQVLKKPASNSTKRLRYESDDAQAPSPNGQAPPPVVDGQIPPTTAVTAVACYPYDKNPDRWYHSATEAWKNVAVIRESLYAEFSCLCYQFSFPVLAHPEDIPLFILGNDCLSYMDIAINVATSTIRMPRYVNFPKAQENYQVLNPQADHAAGEYLNTNLVMLPAENTSEYESQNIEEIELPCSTIGIPLRKGSCSSIRASTRCPYGDLQVLYEKLQ